ncbi:MAG: DUF4124 domain-containing protein [Betaproteobacteria bacterium]|nr:DUF4124 domain-containing protein [Betaproteobacteria bacterium]MDE2049286.1 DUF4124 domain-containing protein [Betaproteobacteria bacterium]
MGTAVKIGVLCVACLLGSAAFAQWGWMDGKGNRQYSDQPPPPEVPDKAIFKRPHGTTIGQPNYSSTTVVDEKIKQAVAAAHGASAPAPAPAPAASKPKDPAEEFAKRQEEQAKAEAEAQKKAAETARLAQECNRARGYVKTLQEGIRVVQTDPQGNRSVLSDAERAREMQRVQSDIAANCK